MKMKTYTICARDQASIFMVFWPFSQKQNCQIVEEVKTLEDKPRSGWPFFHKIEKAVSIGVTIPQNRKVKIFQLHIIDQSFGHNVVGIS